MKNKETVPVIVFVSERAHTNTTVMLASAIQYILNCATFVSELKEHPDAVLSKKMRGELVPICVIFNYDHYRHSAAWDRKMSNARNTWLDCHYNVPFVAVTRDLTDDKFPSSGTWKRIPRFTSTQFDELVEHLQGILQMYTIT